MFYNGSSSHNNLYFELEQSGAHQSAATAIGALQSGAFHHIAAVRSGVDGYVYIDGVQVATSGSLVNPVSSAGHAYIGNSGFSTGYFNGTIEDVRIYNRALSATEIEEIYSGQ
jgi:arabinan endo-1,5-alpha-L-arabinosidase